jgi:putative chitinase
MGLIKIQNRVNVKQDGDFGPITARAIMHYFQLNEEEGAHMLGQFAVESAHFTKFEEDLRHSAANLARTWPTRYALNAKAKEKEPNALALALAFKPEAIANNAYANRGGNGNEASGDGWLFRGRGGIMLTHRNGYLGLSRFMGVPEIATNPEVVLESFLIDCGHYYFETNRIYAETKSVNPGSILKVSRGVNIGNMSSNLTPHNLKERIEWTLKIYQWLRQ